MRRQMPGADGRQRRGFRGAAVLLHPGTLRRHGRLRRAGLCGGGDGRAELRHRNSARLLAQGQGRRGRDAEAFFCKSPKRMSQGSMNMWQKAPQAIHRGPLKPSAPAKHGTATPEQMQRKRSGWENQSCVRRNIVAAKLIAGAKMPYQPQCSPHSFPNTTKHDISATAHTAKIIMVTIDIIISRGSSHGFHVVH